MTQFPTPILSDFFFVWLKRALADMPSCAIHSIRTRSLQRRARSSRTRRNASKVDEKIANSSRTEWRWLRRRPARRSRNDGIGSVVFAHKTTEGWEALLSGMIKGGWIDYRLLADRDRNGRRRLRARESAALATSVHLVCRPRPEDAPDRRLGRIFRELPNRIGDWMERLSSEGVRGADLVFACIGPAMELYSRYSKVEDAEGREIPLGGDPEAVEPYKRGFLAYVWETVGRIALEQILGTAEARARNGAAGALEEDARLTALFLWTIQSTATERRRRGVR